MKDRVAPMRVAWIAGLASALSCAIGVARAAEPAGVGPDEALRQLVAGNARFVSGHLEHPHQSAQRRAEEAGTQHPFAVVVGCSDSRVSPEILFDRGIGDLFVVRTAGNRLDDLVLASIEYSVEHLGTSLVVVLGHERCGAVTAAIDFGKESPATHRHEESVPAGHVPVLLRTMQDAVAAARSTPGDPVENAVMENIRIVTADLPVQSPFLAERIRTGKLKVVAMRYDVDTGAVSPVEMPPPAPSSN